MPRKQQDTFLCQVCKQQKKRKEAIPAELVRTSIVEIIRKSNVEYSPSGYICLTDLNQFRARYVKDVLETEKGDLLTLEEQVMKGLRDQELLSKNINIEAERAILLKYKRGCEIFPKIPSKYGKG